MAATPLKMVQSYLDAHLYDNAVFLAETLHAESNTEESVRLLANTYLRANKPHAAYSVLEGCTDKRGRYLLATAAFRLDRLVEAEAALVGNSKLHLGVQAVREPILADRASVVPGGPNGLYLLGNICRSSGRREEAIECYQLALELDPMLWTAMEALSQLGQPGADVREAALERERPAAAAGGAKQRGASAVARGLSDTLQHMGRALQLVSQYRCDDAIACLSALPAAQRRSAWAQQQLGRCFFEKGMYADCVTHFEKMQSAAPHRLDGVELLSTALWHLKREVELCFLAQRVRAVDRAAPQVWCVMGNALSLQKDHEAAVKFFKRALQVDPSFTYAYSLCGHEYVANEDFDRALACYRHAVRSDERHYNGWYGLGAIYYRQEKFELAEFHFARALELHPSSAVLRCYLGMVRQARGAHEAALEMLDGAIAISPNNPQARFQRANALIQLDRLAEAVEELRIVCDAAPREPSVHTLLGKVLKRLGHAEEARRHFTNALDLDPKDTNFLKGILENDEDDWE